MSLFIVLEGIDGAGTTTQTALLRDRLQADGQPAIQTFEPTNGPIGVMIRQMLSKRIVLPSHTQDAPSEPVTRETLAALFAADRLDHCAALIEPSIDAKNHIISDRYLHSSLAYQGDIEEGDTVDYSWIMQLNSRAKVPDVTFFLKIDLETSLARISQRGAARDIYETREKLERLITRYDEVMEMLSTRGDHIVTIDATQSIDAIHTSIWQHISHLQK